MEFVGGGDLGAGLLMRHSCCGLLHITGKDHLTWLQGIVTADLFNLSDHAFWGLILHRTGKLRGEVIGIVEDTGLWLAIVGGELTDVHKYLDSLIVMDDVNLEIDLATSLWSIHGRKDKVPALLHNCSTAVRKGTLSWIEPNDSVYAVSNSVENDWLAVLRDAGLKPCDELTWEQYRVSHGLPKWSVDYSAQDTPHHAGLFGRAVSPNKGCYIGQEVVCKVEMRGHISQRVTRIKLDSLAGVAVGSDVLDGQTGESVGVITSLAPQQIGQSGWAIARVKSTLIDTHSDVLVGQAKGRIANMLRNQGS